MGRLDVIRQLVEARRKEKAKEKSESEMRKTEVIAEEKKEEVEREVDKLSDEEEPVEEDINFNSKVSEMRQILDDTASAWLQNKKVNRGGKMIVLVKKELFDKSQQFDNKKELSDYLQNHPDEGADVVVFVGEVKIPRPQWSLDNVRKSKKTKEHSGSAPTEAEVISAVKKADGPIARKDIAADVACDPDALTPILKKLVGDGALNQTGHGRGSKYQLPE